MSTDPTGDCGLGQVMTTVVDTNVYDYQIKC